MVETETILINGTPVLVEQSMTSGDLIIASLMTIIISLIIGVVALYLIGGRR